MVEKYKVVCLLTIRDPSLYLPESFEEHIRMFNMANKPKCEVEVITIDKEV